MSSVQTLLRASFILAAAFSLNSLNGANAYAQEMKRIAFSSSMGVEVLGSMENGNWCTTRPKIVLSAENASFFQSGSLETLVSRLAAGLIEKECPEAETLDLSGRVADKAEVVYRAEAAKSASWALTAIDVREVSDPKVEDTSTALDANSDSGNSATSQMSSTTPEQPTVFREETSSSVADASAPTAPGTLKAEPKKMAGAPEGLSPPPHPGLAAHDPMAPPTVAAGWIGEWTGRYECSREAREITFSINKVSGLEFQGAVKVRAGGKTRDGFPREKRGRMSGVFEPESKQFRIAVGRSFAFDNLGGDVSQGHELAGLFSIDELVLRDISIRRHRCSIASMTKVSDTSALVDQIDSEEAWRGEYAKYLFLKPRPNWSLGKLQTETFKVPSCDAVSAWAKGTPSNARFAPSTRDSRTILRHFDDSNSTPVFGKEAANWSDADWKMLRSAVSKCRASGSEAIRTIVEDSDSRAVLKLRFQLKREYVKFIAQQASLSEDDDARYSRLLNLSNPDFMVEALTRMGYSSRFELAELAVFAQDVEELAASLASNLAVPYRQWILEEEQSLRGINSINELYQEAKAVLGKPGRLVLDELGAVAGQKQRDIADGLIQATKAELAELPSGIEKAVFTSEKVRELTNTLSGIALDQDIAALQEMPKLAAVAAISSEIEAIGKLEPTLKAWTEAKARVTQAEASLGALVSSTALLDMKQALRNFAETARTAVLEAAIGRIPSTPSTSDGLIALRADEADVLLAVSEGPSLPEKEVYTIAVQAKADEIGEAAAGVFENSLDLIEPSFRALDEIASLRRQFETDYPDVKSQERVKLAVDTKRQAVIDALAEQEIELLNGHTFAPLEYEVFMNQISAISQEFERLGAKVQADRVLEAGISHANEILDDGIADYRLKQMASPADRVLVPGLRQNAEKLDRDSATLSGLNAYATVDREAALDIIDRECQPILDQADIDRADRELPMLIAGQSATIEHFVCQAYAAGLTPISLKTPGLFGVGEYEIQLFNEKQKLMISIGMVEAEALPGQELLVGSRAGDSVSTYPISVTDWNAFTGNLDTLANLAGGLGLRAACSRSESRLTAAWLGLPADLGTLGKMGIVIPIAC